MDFRKSGKAIKIIIFFKYYYYKMNNIIDELYKEISIYQTELKYDKVIDNYKKIIKYIEDENNKDINININYYKYFKELSEIYTQESKYYEAIEYYIKFLKIEKTNISNIGVTLNDIGVCYSNIKQFKLAIHYFKKVLLIKEIPDVYSNIGLCNINLKNYKEAEINLLKSYKIDKNIQAASSLGSVYYYIKNYDKSIEYYKLNKNSFATLYNSSFSYLAKKNFKKGYELYENRLKENKINIQTKLQDRVEIPIINYWNGIDICNHLLIVYEQGYGDNIQYFRFIIELSNKYPQMKISYFCKKEICDIFTPLNNKNIEIIKEIVNLQKFNYKLYIMSLPKILNITTMIPNSVNYINTNPEKLLFWKNKTKELKKFKVGFVYNGLLVSFIDKYIPIKEFETLLDLDIELICLHRKCDIEKDLVNLNEKIIHYDIDNGVPFEDTIHLLQNLDLLITIDTYIVHLAGVMNIKTLLLLGVSEWRWSNDKNKTYWYDSVKLIRTNENQELKDLLINVKNEIRDILSNNLN